MENALGCTTHGLSRMHTSTLSAEPYLPGSWRTNSWAAVSSGWSNAPQLDNGTNCSANSHFSDRFRAITSFESTHMHIYHLTMKAYELMKHGTLSPFWKNCQAITSTHIPLPALWKKHAAITVEKYSHTFWKGAEIEKRERASASNMTSITICKQMTMTTRGRRIVLCHSSSKSSDCIG